MKHWHEVLPPRYGAVESFNYRYPLKQQRKPGGAYRVLEVGAGLGEHIEHENLNGIEHHALELRDAMAARIRERSPQVKTQVGDIQKTLEVPAGYFDRVVAIHVLEHLPADSVRKFQSRHWLPAFCTAFFNHLA
jgi:SAM-dependent methyltransferase